MMAGPATSSTTGVAGIAAAMSFMPFGVSLSTLVLGGTCFFGGACARTGLSLYRKLDGTDIVTLQSFFRAIAALLCTIPLAAVASCIVFLGAHVLKMEADAAFGGLLLIMGLRGPEGFQWLMDTFTNIFMKILPGNKGSGGGP
jgi:hypothetical protein